MLCQAKGCDRLAAFAPTIKLWAAGYSKATPAIEIDLALPLCAGCMETTYVEDLLTDAVFDRVTAAVAGAGAAPPDRTSAELDARPSSAPDRFTHDHRRLN